MKYRQFQKVFRFAMTWAINHDPSCQNRARALKASDRPSLSVPFLPSVKKNASDWKRGVFRPPTGRIHFQQGLFALSGVSNPRVLDNSQPTDDLKQLRLFFCWQLRDVRASEIISIYEHRLQSLQVGGFKTEIVYLYLLSFWGVEHALCDNLPHRITKFNLTFIRMYLLYSHTGYGITGYFCSAFIKIWKTAEMPLPTARGRILMVQRFAWPNLLVDFLFL